MSFSTAAGGGGGGSRQVLLVSEDGKQFRIDAACATQIGILKGFPSWEEVIQVPVPIVKSTILSRVVEFLQQHCDDPVAGHRHSCPEPAAPPPVGEKRDDGELPLPQVHGLLLESNHASENEDDNDDEYLVEEYLAHVTPWDQRFLDDLDMLTLIELTKAANYLYIPPLLDLCCRTIARQISGLKAEEIRKKFNLPNDFTPEEEAKMAAEFAWIEE